MLPEGRFPERPRGIAQNPLSRFDRLLLSLLVPAFATQPVKGDADDPAIWVDRAKPTESRILGTDKKGGRLYVFDLQGKVVQTLGGLVRPNSVDVLRGFAPGFDLALVTERDADRLRAYRIDATGRLVDVSGKLDSPAPMGVALYKDAAGVAYAYVSPKQGPERNYIARLSSYAEFGQGGRDPPAPHGRVPGRQGDRVARGGPEGQAPLVLRRRIRQPLRRSGDRCPDLRPHESRLPGRPRGRRDLAERREVVRRHDGAAVERLALPRLRRRPPLPRRVHPWRR